MQGNIDAGLKLQSRSDSKNQNKIIGSAFYL